MKHSLVVAALAMAGLIMVDAPHPADAATIQSTLFVGELNQLSDNSGESQNVDLLEQGILDVGDTLRGTMNFQSIEDLTGGGGSGVLGAAGVNELTAIFEAQVTSLIILTDDNDSCNAASDFLDDGIRNCSAGAIDGDETANYTFGAYAGFAAEFGLSAGTAIAFYEDPTPDYDRTFSTRAAIEATAVNGALVAELGFGLDADEFWGLSGASTDSDAGSSVAQGTSIGAFNIQLSVLGGSLFADIVQVPAGKTGSGGDGLIDVNGSGGISGTLGSSSFYDQFDNVDLVFRPVPEPTTLGLLGIGLLGFGGMARRRRGGGAS